jgi:hypothetical protein
LLLRLAFRCRGDWIRTSDLLNPIQEDLQHNVPSEQGLTSSPSTRCTSGCTSGGNQGQTANIEALAAVLLALSPAERAMLAAVLIRDAK